MDPRVIGILAGLAVAGSVAIGLPESASASYPGRNGAIAFTQASFALDPYNGGGTESFDLYTKASAARARPRDLVHCTADEGDNSNALGMACPTGAPAFSPDGRQLVFTEDVPATANQCVNTGVPFTPESCPTTLALAQAGRRGVRTLAPLTADDQQPAFLPDGQTIVFAGRPSRHAPFDLYTVTSDGTGLTRLTLTGGSQPAPCANGSIAYVHDGDLYLLGPDHRTERRLTRAGASSPDCSGDGRSIAFVRHRDLYVISATAARLRRLTKSHILIGRPAFAPGSGQIAALTFFCPRRGHCCDSLESKGNCVQQANDVEVVNLNGRIASMVRVGGCYDNGEGSQSCDAFDGLAWQPLAAAAVG